MEEIIINESFSDEDTNILEKIEKRDFESYDLLKLKVEAEEISHDTNITELISYSSIKKNLEYSLPHQPEGALRILRDMNCTALLADEVGLGKTVTAGIVIRECIERGFVKRAIVLTPPSLVDQWVAELKEKFKLDFKIIETEADWENNLVIASLDRVKTYNKKLHQFRHQKAHEIPWDLLIVDEAHKLKDKSTVRWEFVDKIQKKRFLILTATPFQNDLMELYNLLHLLKRGHLGTIKEFKKKFLFRGNKRRPLNPRDLKRRLDEAMVRRRRDETIVNYKKRIPKIISVELTKEEYEAYEGTCDLLKTKYFSCTGSAINGLLIIFALLPKITSSSRSAIESLTNIAENPKYHESTREMAKRILNQYKDLKVDSKMNKLVEIVGQIQEEEKENLKILIYTKHPTTLSYIVERLKPYNLKIVEFMGGLDREEKTKRIKEFKESANIMISTETGSEGLNFQFCHNLINYDLPWNPMAVEQRIGRLDRIGQTKDINIYSLATKDTMEEHVVDLIINKMCCIGLVIGELPIILFNLGLDERREGNRTNIEEMLMESFIDSKNNLSKFAADVGKIAEMIDKGIAEYTQAKTNAEVLDAKHED